MIDTSRINLDAPTMATGLVELRDRTRRVTGDLHPTGEPRRRARELLADLDLVAVEIVKGATGDDVSTEDAWAVLEDLAESLMRRRATLQRFQGAYAVILYHGEIQSYGSFPSEPLRAAGIEEGEEFIIRYEDLPENRLRIEVEKISQEPR